jgi:hypothetical protein
LAEGTYPLNVNYLGLGNILLFLLGGFMVFLEEKITAADAGWKYRIVYHHPVLFYLCPQQRGTFNDRILFSYTLPEPLLRLWVCVSGTNVCFGRVLSCFYLCHQPDGQHLPAELGGWPHFAAAFGVN